MEKAALDTKLLRGPFESDHVTNNVATGQDKAKEERGEGERAVVLLLLRRGVGGGLRCLLLPLIKITQQLSQT